MRIASAAMTLLLSLLTASHCSAAEDAGVRLGDSTTHKRKVGVIINAVGGPCLGLYATAPLPTDWPEQQVKIINEEFSPSVFKTDYRMLDGNVKQLLVSIPQLAGGEQAMAVVTLEITTRAIHAPADTDQFEIPRRVARDVQIYLAPSPYINSRHTKVRAKVREIVSDDDPAWTQVEAIYDWVRDNITNRDGQLKGEYATLRDGHGDAEDLVGLFVALCRAHRVPARIVWVPGHFHAEFYLVDADGDGHWFPCQVVGAREFGSLEHPLPILQKGDNIRVPEKKDPQRYVGELLKGTGGAGKPRVQFVRESFED